MTDLPPTIIKPDELPIYSKKDKYWTSDADGEKEVHYSKSGPASEEAFKAITFPELMRRAAELKGDKPALCVERPVEPLEKLPVVDGKPEIPPALPLGEWKTWTYQDYFDDVKKIAKGLIAAGFVAHDACNIFGFNSPEWTICQGAAIFAGGKSAVRLCLSLLLGGV